MNVLLVYPEFPDTFWSFKHALKFIRKRALSPPLGLLTVAALLPEAWHKRLVDLNVTPHLTDAGPGVGRQGLHQRHDRATILGARRGPALPRRPECRWWRAARSSSPSTQDFPEVDHFVLNEAELTPAAVPAGPGGGTPAARVCHARSSRTSSRPRRRSGSCST